MSLIEWPPCLQLSAFKSLGWGTYLGSISAWKVNGYLPGYLLIPMQDNAECNDWL
jgi:hypothetical protein